MGIITDSVNKQMYELLRRQILSGHYKAGERIDSKTIAKENGISAMPVRNALSHLTSDGLVVNRERVGFFVRKFTQDEIVEIINARKMFEIYCLDTFFDQLDISQVRNFLKEFGRYDQLGPEVLENLDFEMHKMFVYASHNHILIDTYERLSAMFSLGYFVCKENIHVANKEHMDILEAILIKNKAGALKCLEAHLNRVCEEVIQLYNE